MPSATVLFMDAQGCRGPAPSADPAAFAKSLQKDVHAALRGSQLAIAVYGSQARGTAKTDSDVDVLQLSNDDPGSYSAGLINVTRYRPRAILSLALRGSLFVLHLKTDAVILLDETRVLTEALARYKPPESYEPLYLQIRHASAALSEVLDTQKYQPRLLKLGIYLLRTAVYAKLAELGRPIFDIERACETLGDPILLEALDLRRSEDPLPGSLKLLREAVARIVGTVPSNPYGSVEALALELSAHSNLAAQLVSQVLATHSEVIDYANLAPSLL